MFVITDVKKQFIIFRCAYKNFRIKIRMATVLLRRIKRNLLLSKA